MVTAVICGVGMWAPRGVRGHVVWNEIWPREAAAGDYSHEPGGSGEIHSSGGDAVSAVPDQDQSRSISGRR